MTYGLLEMKALNVRTVFPDGINLSFAVVDKDRMFGIAQFF
jgi:hypothetical protein